MRNLVNCAITVAVLVSGVASQIVTPPKNPVEVPYLNTWRAQVADLSNDNPVADQWNAGTSMFTFQWDFDTNSYSEEWRTPKSIIYSRDVLNG